ncbi:MAG: N-6 DNA methylase [Bacillota bacterium]
MSEIIKNKLKEVGCDKIQEQATIKVKNKNITYDLIGFIDGQAKIGIDKSQDDEDTKQIGLLSILSQSDKIDYYGSYNHNTQQFKWYKLTEGNISQLDEIPILKERTEINLEDVKKQLVKLFSLLRGQEKTELKFIKLFLGVMNSNKSKNNLTEAPILEQIQESYQQLVKNSSYKLEGEISVSDSKVDNILNELLVMNLSNFENKELLFLVDEVLMEGCKKSSGVKIIPPAIAKAIDKTFAQSKREVTTIIDGAAGIGQLLTAAKHNFPQGQAIGVGKDNYQIELAKLRSLFLGQDNKFEIFNSLKLKGDTARAKLNLEQGADLIVSMPEVGININDQDLLSDYETATKSRMKIEELYVELYLDFLIPGGYLALVLPERILTNSRTENIRKFMLDKAILKAVISLPKNINRNIAAMQSSLVIMKKKETEGEEQSDVFMATPENEERLDEVVQEMIDWGELL